MKGKDDYLTGENHDRITQAIRKLLTLPADHPMIRIINDSSITEEQARVILANRKEAA